MHTLNNPARMADLGGLTLIQSSLQNLAYSQQLDPRPHIRPLALGHAERPAPAVEVPPVLPHGPEPGLEEVDALAHLDLVDGSVILVTPEVLHGFDLSAELFEVGIVFLAFGGLVLVLPID